MKVLIIHQYFKTPETGGALRSYYLARALVDAGVETSVITTYNGSSIRKEIVEGIEVHYLPIIYNNSFGFVKRVRSFLQFVWSIVKEAGQFKHVDVCYAISTPLTTGIAARWIKSRYKIPYIFEVGDLWPEAPIQLGIVKNPLLKVFLRSLERRIYRGAQQIVALSNPIKDSIKRTCPNKLVHVIPNMADTGYFMPAEKSAELVERFGVQGKFVVSYIGTFGLANGLDHMLDCAIQSRNAGLAVHFLLCGEGAMLTSIKQRIHEESLDNLTIMPFQNRAGVRDILNVTDAIFVSFQKVAVLETGSPNKYFDGLAAGKFVIVNFGGWIENEITTNRCGIKVDQAREEFVQRMRGVINNHELLLQSSKAARKLAEEKYSRKTLSEKFVNILRSHGNE